MDDLVWLLDSKVDFDFELIMPIWSVALDAKDFDIWDELTTLRLATNHNHYCFILCEPDKWLSPLIPQSALTFFLSYYISKHCVNLWCYRIYGLNTNTCSRVLPTADEVEIVSGSCESTTKDTAVSKEVYCLVGRDMTLRLLELNYT